MTPSGGMDGPPSGGGKRRLEWRLENEGKGFVIVMIEEKQRL